MIMTIGYDGRGFTTADLAKILDDTGAILVDARLTPFSRIKGWGTVQLKAAIGADRYLSRKDLGAGNITAAALDWLEETYYHPGAPHCVLLCKEENPGACHRHHNICAGRFPDAIHIYRENCMSAAEYDDLLENNIEPDTLVPTADLHGFIEHCESLAG